MGRVRRAAAALLTFVAAACGGSSTARPVASADVVVVTPGVSTRIAYGDDANQFGHLTVPAGADGHVPIVMLIHGGFWRTGFGLDLMEPLVPSLLDAGYAVWNVEYRRVGSGPEGGGGYPATFDDLAAAIDLLAALPTAEGMIDIGRVAIVGHSAGGHLAGWLASRSELPADAPWADPAVVPVLAVSQAGVLDLDLCIAERVGGTACTDLLGGTDVAERVALTSPAALVPTSATVVAVHGTADGIVPINQSEAYVAAATAAGGEARLVPIEGADHFAMIDADHPAWFAVLDALGEQFGSD